MFKQMAKVLSTMVFAQIISWIVNLGMRFTYSLEGKHSIVFSLWVITYYWGLIFCVYFSAPNFHLPHDLTVPLILIGPGTGIAPFRGFWHHRRALLNSGSRLNAGPVWLFFGCRTKTMDLYREEKENALKEGVLSKVFLALSREKNVPKVKINSLL